MKEVKLETKVYYHGDRYIPFLEHPRYGKFPLKEDNNKRFFVVPTPYAKNLLEKSPTIFSAEANSSNAYESATLENLKDLAKERGLKFAPNTGKEKMIGLLVAADKELKPEEDPETLKKSEE